MASGEFPLPTTARPTAILGRADDRMPELEKLMTSVLMCEAGNLPPESTPLRDLKGWDSLKHVLLVVGLEKHLNAQLTAEEIQAIVTLADVARVLGRKSGDA